MYVLAYSFRITSVSLEADSILSKCNWASFCLSSWSFPALQSSISRLICISFIHFKPCTADVFKMVSMAIRWGSMKTTYLMEKWTFDPWRCHTVLKAHQPSQSVTGGKPSSHQLYGLIPLLVASITSLKVISTSGWIDLKFHGVWLSHGCYSLPVWMPRRTTVPGLNASGCRGLQGWGSVNETSSICTEILGIWRPGHKTINEIPQASAIHALTELTLILMTL